MPRIKPFSRDTRIRGPVLEFGGGSREGGRNRGVVFLVERIEEADIDSRYRDCEPGRVGGGGGCLFFDGNLSVDFFLLSFLGVRGGEGKFAEDMQSFRFFPPFFEFFSFRARRVEQISRKDGGGCVVSFRGGYRKKEVGCTMILESFFQLSEKKSEC